MKTETIDIIGGNKIIAEFMGHKYSQEHDFMIGLCRVNELVYHSSWDWIMPVVEKIEGLGYPTEIYYEAGEHQLHGFMIEIDLNDICVTSKDKIDAVYKTVIQFINWYNQQNENNRTAIHAV